MNDATTLDRPVQPTLQVRQIVPGQNYREHYDAKALADLREQVKAAGGIKSPIMVRPHPSRDGVWEIVYGHRRWMVAGEQYGDTYDMPVTIEDLSDAEARALGIIENKGRDNPSAIEEAKGAADLLRFNAGDKEKTANQLGWKPRELDNRLLLLNCAPEVQKAVIERHPHISIGHAELLAGLPQDRQVKVLAGILQHKVPVEVLKKQLGQYAKRLSEATLLDRDQLEAILLNPSAEEAQPLVCSDNAVVAYLPVPASARAGRLRHVLAAAHELLTRIAAEAIKGRSLIDSPTVMKDFLRVYFAGAERETFVVVFLDANHRVIEVEELFAGTLTQTSVYPREVVKRALHFNAAAVCLSHVHPSSQTEPSRADEFLTATLRQALSLIDVRVIDHIIVAANGSSLTSMAERGLL